MKKAYTALIAAASVAVNIPHGSLWALGAADFEYVERKARSGGFAQAGPDDDFVERRTQTAALIFFEKPQFDERLHVGVHVLVVPPQRTRKRPDLQPLVSGDMANQLQPLFRYRAEQLRDAAKGEPRGRFAPGARLPPRTRKGGERRLGTQHFDLDPVHRHLHPARRVQSSRKSSSSFSSDSKRYDSSRSP